MKAIEIYETNDGSRFDKKKRLLNMKNCAINAIR